MYYVVDTVGQYIGDCMLTVGALDRKVVIYEKTITSEVCKILPSNAIPNSVLIDVIIIE